MFTRQQCTYNPKQLYDALVEDYHPNKHAEFTIVTSAWYGKRTVSAEHEFILIEVEDTAIDGLKNYLVLERDPGDTSHAPSGIIAHTRAAFQGTRANDTFKVSYDGNMEELLATCELESCIYLEQLEFDSDEPLLLYKLATLADIVSKRYPYYHFVFSNCYLFAGLVWECMRKMCPRAIHRDFLVEKRGKYGTFPCASIAFKVGKVYNIIRDKIPEVESILKEKRAVSSLKLLIMLTYLNKVLCYVSWRRG